MCQGDRVPFDVINAHVQQVVQGSGQLVDGPEGRGRVSEFPGVFINRVPVVGQPFVHHSPSQAIGPDHVHHVFPYIEGCDSVTAKQPLVRARGEEVDPGFLDVEVHHAYTLHRVRVQVTAVSMGQVRERLQVVPVAVAVGYPRHGDQFRLVIYHLGEGFRRGDAVHVAHDARFHAGGLGQLAVHHKRCRVVQIVDHHVVPGLQIQGVGHDVLALAGGRYQSDFPDFRPDQAGEFLSRGPCLLEHFAHQNGTPALGFHETGGCFYRRQW